jgi:hypothetical protein
MKKLSQIHDWFLRTVCCAIWVIALVLFLINLAVALANTDDSWTYAKHAIVFGFIFFVAVLSHAFLGSVHVVNAPKDDGNYPPWDIE